MMMTDECDEKIVGEEMPSEWMAFLSIVFRF